MWAREPLWTTSPKSTSLQDDKTVSSYVGSTTAERRNTNTVVLRQGETCPSEDMELALGRESVEESSKDKN